MRSSSTSGFRVSAGASSVLCIFWLSVVTASLVGSLGTTNDMFEANNHRVISNLSPVATQHAGAIGAARNGGRRATGFKRNANQQNSTDMIVHEREFSSPQVRVQMECQRDKTTIRLNFTQPFTGILGAGKLDTTACKLQGNGTRYYVLQVAHNETQCDTQWDSTNSSIFNTLFVRFHSSLETGLDIAKNIMCRLTVGDLVVGRRPTIKKPNQRIRAAAAAV